MKQENIIGFTPFFFLFYFMGTIFVFHPSSTCALSNDNKILNIYT